MENCFFIDSEYLSKEALNNKHRLETDPSFRKNHMEYLPGMEQITSDICTKVMAHMNSYDADVYTDAADTASDDGNDEIGFRVSQRACSGAVSGFWWEYHYPPGALAVYIR